MLSLLGLGYPAVVDGAYAASAAMRFYSQTLDQYEYCRVITDSVRRVSPGCPAAVRSALHLLCLAAASASTERSRAATRAARRRATATRRRCRVLDRRDACCANGRWLQAGGAVEAGRSNTHMHTHVCACYVDIVECARVVTKARALQEPLDFGRMHRGRRTRCTNSH